MTKRRALEICRDLWLWLAENPKLEKCSWPGWEFNKGNIEICDNYCPCCEFVGRLNDCSMCPMMTVWNYSIGNPCMSTKSPYKRWEKAVRPKTRTKYALIIANGAIAELQKMKVRKVK